MQKQKPKPGPHLEPEKRHAIILAALQPDANISQIARDHEVHRNTIYDYLQYVLVDPKRKMQDAEAEAVFRRKVWELIR